MLNIFPFTEYKYLRISELPQNGTKFPGQHVECSSEVNRKEAVRIIL